MDLNVNFSAEDINKQISEEIAKSVLGKHLKEAIEKAVAQVSSTYNNPFEGVIRSYIYEEMRRIVEAEFKERIRAYITEQLSSDAVLEKVVGDLFRGYEKMKDRY